MTRLGIVATGMVTPVGYNAASSCAAIRCGIDGFGKTAFKFDGEWQRGAVVEVPGGAEGVEKLAWMAAVAIKEALDSTRGHEGDTAIAICLSEEDRPGRPARLNEHFLTNVVSRLDSSGRIGPERALFARGSLGGAEALQWAEKVLSDGTARYCIVAGVDSYLSGPTLVAYHAKRRLISNRHGDGFLPGEAAAAITLTSGAGAMECLGVGWGRERATQDSGEPLRGDGLSQAYRAALKAAGCGYESLDYRLADVAGDQYAFKEAALALQRTMRVRKEAFYLWHPADCVGRVGAASVPLVLGIAVAAARRSYAPGPGVLCHFTEDGERRAAVVVREGVIVMPPSARGPVSSWPPVSVRSP